MFRTRTEVWESLKDSFFTALVFLGFGAVLVGILMGIVMILCRCTV